MTALAAVALAAAGIAAGGGCGGEEDEPAAPSRFAAALATVAGAEPLGFGYGWVDLERLSRPTAERRAELAWAANALGPGARDVLKGAGAAKRIGLDVLAARSALSLVTSYALALRIDGVDAARVEAALARIAEGARLRHGWRLFDLGDEWSAPLGTPFAALGSLAARDAVDRSAVVLARSDSAREAIVSPRPPAIDAELVEAAARCLGDVVAARLVLNNHTHLPNVGPDLLAFAVTAASGGEARDVLCAIDTSEGTVEAAAESLRVAFDPGARDLVSGEAMRDLVADFAVATYDEAGLRVARATLTPAPRAEPGLLFSAFDRGSLLTYIGLQPPPTPGSRAGG